MTGLANATDRAARTLGRGGLAAALPAFPLGGAMVLLCAALMPLAARWLPAAALRGLSYDPHAPPGPAR